MEYNVTAIAEEPIELLSASAAELGDQAGAITWRNCLECAERLGDAIGLDYDDARNHFREYGAWEDDEIDAWTPRELQALVIQETAASLREIEAGGEDGRTFTGDDGETYIYLGI